MKTLALLFFIFCTINLYGQNKVINPSFEEYNFCPLGVSTVVLFPGNSSVKNWNIPTTGTADYFNVCGVRSVGVPANGMGSQPARTGNAYTGAYIFNSYREYLQTQLDAPLIADHEYLVSFWVSLADKSSYATDQIAAYFSKEYLVRNNNYGDPLDDLVPQVSNKAGNWIMDTAGWTRISGSFIATGGEQALILGNFASHADQRGIAVSGSSTGNSYGYYYFDDVCVVDMTTNSPVSAATRTLCRDSLLTLSGKTGSNHYLWSTGDTTGQIRIGEAGTYWVKTFGECEAWIDTFRVIYPEAPTFSLGEDTVLCTSSALTLQAPTIPNTSFTWQDGSQAKQYVVTETGTYSIILQKEGCSYTDTIRVIINNFKQNLGKDTLLCKHSPYQIALTANIPPGAEVLWQNGSNAPVLYADTPGVYFVVVRDPLCINTDTIVISEVLCDCNFNMPNAFSPNQDGLNDMFKPGIEPGCPVTSYRFSIYNRFGQRVYYSAQPERGWDGMHNGIPADAGTYFYEVSFQGGIHQVKYNKNGDLLLIR